MNVWYHLSTILKRCLALRIAGLGTLCVAFITALLFANVSSAAPGVNQTLSFQGRLTNTSGGIVPDGYYNIQFKIYQDGAGTSAGNSGGTLKWTESYVNNGGTSGVQVKNGYFSVTLGANNPFGSSVDWNQDTLWLSMNVAGTSTSCTTFGSAPCTADGEMLPMKRLTAVPYALNAKNANALDGLTSAGFIQNQTSLQQTTSGFWISGSARADTSVLAPSLDTASATTLSIGTSNANAITLGKSGVVTTIPGDVIANAGVILQGTYTTTESYRFGVMGTLNSSATSSQYGVQNEVNFNPSGASLSNLYASSNIATVTGSSLTIGNVYGSAIQLNTSAGFTGTITNAYGTRILAPSLSGAGGGDGRKIANYSGILIDGTSNGGNTSNTINNYGMQIQGNSATAGSGGTLNNYGLHMTLSSGGATGTTRNYGIYLTGNGGGASTNWAIYNDSTAANYLQGNTMIGTSSQANSAVLTVQGSISSSGTVYGTGFERSSSGSMTIGSVNATAIDIGNSSSNIATTVLGTMIVKPTTGNNSTAAFQLQRADGTAMFVADSTNQTITIGNSGSGNYTLISTSTGQITKYGTGRNTKKIILNAEYTGSVLDAGSGSNNSGTMTSSVDLTNRMNYYKWTTSQGTNQNYDVVVQVPLPTDFDGWAGANPLSISTYTSNTSNGTITLEARDSANAVQCNFVSVTPGSTGAWATNTSACTLSSGTYTAGDAITLRIRMQSPASGDVRVGNINLSYYSKY